MASDELPEVDLTAEGLEDCTVCFCHNVRLSQLLAAIRNGATGLGEIQDTTRASTGCGGCECDVLQQLEAELARQAANKAKAG